MMPDTPGGPVVATRNPDHLRTLRELGMKSLLCVPINGRSGVEGVMMLVATDDPHRYGPEDVVLARELAARAAVSLETAACCRRRWTPCGCAMTSWPSRRTSCGRR